MLKTNDPLPENTVVHSERTIEEARDYEKKRFGSSKRVKRLDTFEKTFAQRLFRMVGSDSRIVDIPCGNGRFLSIFSGAM